MTTPLEPRSTTALRFLGILLFSLWVNSLTPWMAQAQTTAGEQLVTGFVPPAPFTVDESSAISVASADSVTSAPSVDSGYWIVSTRNANSEVENGLPCHYEVLRFDGTGPGRQSSMPELLASLQPSVPVCFMAHGSFVTWDSMLNDSAGTNRWLRQAAPCRPLHLVFYTWASNDGELLTHLRVNKFGNRAALNGFYLADLVSQVSLDHPISLIGHSHGTRLVSAALHSMAGGKIQGKILSSGPQPTRRLRVVLAAAAIDHDWLNRDEKYGLALCPTEGVLNLRNHMDLPLIFYPLRRPFSHRALAITGVTSRDRKAMCDVESKIVDQDVSRLIGFGHLWACYYRQPAIAATIRHYVYFDEYDSQTSASR